MRGSLAPPAPMPSAHRRPPSRAPWRRRPASSRPPPPPRWRARAPPSPRCAVTPTRTPPPGRLRPWRSRRRAAPRPSPCSRAMAEKSATAAATTVRPWHALRLPRHHASWQQQGCTPNSRPFRCTPRGGAPARAGPAPSPRPAPRRAPAAPPVPPCHPRRIRPLCAPQCWAGTALLASGTPAASPLARRQAPRQLAPPSHHRTCHTPPPLRR
mmetsp:Transcript_8195/g.24417  ORF Transcript_8195/g.24417 Transcript_8195/m.24417 type:complete len:212 (+) Transcript_8195:96-731(+)